MVNSPTASIYSHLASCQDTLYQTQMIYQDIRRNPMQADIKYKAYCDKKINASKLKEADYVYVLELKEDHQRKTPILRNFVGLAPTLSRRWYQITIICYAKLTPTRLKCFIACECFNSHPNSPYLIYKSRHKKENPIRKRASNTMICRPMRGSWTDNFWRRKTKHNAVQFTRRCSTFWFINRSDVEHKRNRTRVFPRSFSPNGRTMWRNRYVSLHGTWCGNNLGTTEQ